MPECFVVMGFGKKTDFVQNKTFDLDKSYRYIIKPAVEAAGYTCVRADEIQHAGNINVPMYEQLFQADLVIADLSTANPNAFFELGVRYALKPRTTIVIAEKGFKIPFDMGQVIVRSYEHLGTGIDHGEVERMKAALTEACREVTAANRTDSPVYTFLTNLVPPAVREAAAAAERASNAAVRDALAEVTDEDQKAALTTPLGPLLHEAMSARMRGDFKRAKAIFGGIKAAQGDSVDIFVLQQLATATYLSEDPDPRQAVLEAREIARKLSPHTSADPETLGVWGAIHKRLYEMGGEGPDPLVTLQEAIDGYGRGFFLRNDYYTGINFAFLITMRAAAHSTGDDVVADRVLARRVRSHVLALCQELLAAGIRADSEQARLEQEYWVRATIVEAQLGLGQTREAYEAFEAAKNMTPPPERWMVETTERRLVQLRGLLEHVDAARA
jgi:hypothetical protein